MIVRRDRASSDDDVRTLSREPFGDGGADAATGASDERAPTREAARHYATPLSTRKPSRHSPM
jgi:hypothetical protein